MINYCKSSVFDQRKLSCVDEIHHPTGIHAIRDGLQLEGVDEKDPREILDMVYEIHKRPDSTKRQLTSLN